MWSIFTQSRIVSEVEILAQAHSDPGINVVCFTTGTCCWSVGVGRSFQLPTNLALRHSQKTTLRGPRCGFNPPSTFLGLDGHCPSRRHSLVLVVAVIMPHLGHSIMDCVSMSSHELVIQRKLGLSYAFRISRLRRVSVVSV